MYIESLVIIFFLGLTIGSFLNCLAYRLSHEEDGWLTKFLRGRSICPGCRHTLESKDLIPVISFAWLGGKCRYCKQKISWQYPLVELLTAGIFTFIFYQQGISLPALFGIGTSVDWMLWRNWLIAGTLIVVFLVDLKKMIIPDKIILPAGIIIFLANLYFGFSWSEMLISGVIIGGFFLIQYLVSKGKWIGFGDVKFGLVIGIFFGWWGLLALFLAYIIGGITATILLLGKFKHAKSQVPFGPFLVIGSLLTLFWGPMIWEIYQRIILLN
ncbi:MAG: prepilin peptidase [Patescibacteria group bacterium]